VSPSISTGKKPGIPLPGEPVKKPDKPASEPKPA